MNRLIVATLVLGLVAAGCAGGTPQSKRAGIDLRAEHALKRLFNESDKAKRLYDSAHGYAVFNVTKVAVGVTGGGGRGVAVAKGTGDRTYMNMGTGGLGIGLGGQVYDIVFLFEDGPTFKSFIENGWEASSSANAVAGRAGANAGASFTNGLAVYQLTDAGLLLQADISGTRYWKSGAMNEK